MDKKTLKKELQLIRSTINSVAGIEDEDEALLQYAYEAVNNLIQSLADQPENQLDDIDVVDIQAQQHEPVAWFELLREARDNCKASIVEEGISASRKKYRIDLEARLTAALNTSPPPASKPLTDEQIAEIAAQGHQRWLEFARAIEAAHGIKENE